MPDHQLQTLAPQVWAYYHPFYGTPQGPAGRWLSRNEPLHLGTGYGQDQPQLSLPTELAEKLAHDPERFLSPGRRDNYSVFYPTLELYDCMDRAVLAQHAKWAVQAGLDGLIWDFMIAGEDNHVGLEPHRHFAELRHALRAHVRAGVDVRYLQDREAVPGRGERRKLEVHATHARQIEGVGKTVACEAERARGGQRCIFDEFSTRQQFGGYLRRPRSPWRHG